MLAGNPLERCGCRTFLNGSLIGREILDFLKRFIAWIVILSINLSNVPQIHLISHRGFKSTDGAIFHAWLAYRNILDGITWQTTISHIFRSRPIISSEQRLKLIIGNFILQAVGNFELKKIHIKTIGIGKSQTRGIPFCRRINIPRNLRKIRSLDHGFLPRFIILTACRRLLCSRICITWICPASRKTRSND